MENLADKFSKMRLNPKEHLGLGDIRLTIGEQDEIVKYCNALEKLAVSVEECWHAAHEDLKKVKCRRCEVYVAMFNRLCKWQDMAKAALGIEDAYE